MNGWIGVDLDGTLAAYESWRGIQHIGPPIPAMVDRVKTWLSEGKKVKIFTARVCQAQDGFTIEQIAGFVQDWTEKHLGARLEVTNKKDFAMVDLWDDRCTQVLPNTGIPIT